MFRFSIRDVLWLTVVVIGWTAFFAFIVPRCQRERLYR